MVFRGGTALNKIYLNPPSRYSEDIDFVQIKSEPIGDVIEAIHLALDSWLGIPKRKITERGIKLIYRYQSIENISARLKIEINTTEHYNILPLEKINYRIDSDWFKGNTEILTYHLDELMGSKLGVLKEFPNADKFDKQIRGWVRYWNEILKPDEILNANLIKALMATESGFDQNSDNKTKNIHARGLMQIRDQTLHILGDHKGELKDYLIHLAANNLLDLSANICVGVRWLFQKKKLASARLKRTASWEEAIIEYKGYWDEVKKGNDPKPMQHLREYFNRLQKGI